MVDSIFSKGASVVEIVESETVSSPIGRRSVFIERDGGFTGIAVVIALTLTIALIFTSAQVYRINSVAADIQFVADAGALAAENVVAEYYVIARIADAVILSLSLFGIVVYGISIVVSCIPYLQSVGAELMGFGNRVFKARDEMADQARIMLANLQKALPFLAMLNASSVMSANGFSPSGDFGYHGVALLVPMQGEEATFADDEAAERAAGEIHEKNEETAQTTDDAEEARRKMDQAKLDGYMADCGSDPNYCMYERAAHLAGLAGMNNPDFSSVDLWKFDYALDRAEAYYKRRATTETPEHNGLQERIDSRVRQQFFTYAIEEMGRAYAFTGSDGVLEAYFPLLARKYEEIRTTRLYTDAFFPVDGSGRVHGVSDCPEIEGGITASASVADLENGRFVSCPSCDIGMATIGKVASASSNIENGFEYHYRKVADAASRYATASKEYAEAIGKAKESAGEAFDDFERALDVLKSPRLDPKPPGRNGCIVIAFDPQSHAMPGAFTSSFISGDATLSPRVAISAAALVEEGATEGNSILSSFLDRVSAQSDGSGSAGFVLGAFDGVLGIWGDLLLAYTNGTDSLVKGVGDFLRSIPLVKSTPLASWAEKTLGEALEACGLQGVNLSTPKPVVVNSIHVINAGDSDVLDVLGEAKKGYSSLPGSGSGTVIDALTEGITVAVDGQGNGLLGGEFTLFTISFGDIPGLPEIPIKVKLPTGPEGRGGSP